MALHQEIHQELVWGRMDTCICRTGSLSPSAVHLKLSHIVNWLYPNTKEKVKKSLEASDGAVGERLNGGGGGAYVYI